MEKIEQLCAKLKEKRKKLKYTLEEVVEKTKLHPSVIKDIEETNLENINPTYLKGFIKIYASFLGVEVGDILEQLFPQESKEIVVEEKKKKISSFEFKRYVIFSFILIILVSLGYFSFRFFKNFILKKKITKTQRPSFIAKDSSLTISIFAKRTCFLKVKVDGDLFFEGVLEKGMQEGWQGVKEIELSVSDGSALLLEVNGKKLPPLTSLKKPIRSIKITPLGISVEK
ncbi:MAG TPA: helix-turn-helix domain-containing protein [Candidatus Omnitrophica bacterium]|nr:helix-turn-helix domain-containing protein [Candidatus Omnitrophota bacterium]